MHRATSVLEPGSWPEAHRVGTVTLAYLERHRRRWRLVTDQGEALLLDLANARLLAEGDGLLLEDGGIVEVRAALEELLEIRAGTAGLPRLAYHLGNRHLPIQLVDDALLIRRDHVIAEMVRGLGGEVAEVMRPFTPEAGAYGGGHHHHHDGEEHDHEH